MNLGAVGQLVARELHEDAFEAVQIGLRVHVPNTQLLACLIVEVVEELLPRACHRFVDLHAQFELESVKSCLDLPGLTAALVDGGDPFLEVHAAFHSLIVGAD
jgi:hypothetical protein